MAHEKLRPNYFFDESKIEQLKQIAPECFEDGKINFETLKQNLGDWSLDEEDPELEHFGLFWPGKRDARKAATIQSEGTLKPVFGEGLKSDGTVDVGGENDSKNVFIEGENLEVLKLLQKSYANKVKLIYIDPPYNTGSDFIYDDDFTEPLQAYLRRTGQVDEEGKVLTTNKRGDGRFHSKWLSMIYPRLRLARNLLRDDGVIFVSIDDNEVHNLRAVMNEVFGEENHIAQIVWQKRKGGGNDSKYIAKDHEYILIYTKNIDSNEKWRVPYETEYLKRYKESDDIGKYYWDTLSRDGLQSPIIYDIECPDGSVIKNGKWQISEDTLISKLEKKEIKFSQNEKGKWSVHHMVRQPEGRVFRSIINDVINGDSAKEIEELFGVKKIFDNPKPTELLKKIILLATEQDDLVMDFFAGSASFGDSVFQINKEFNKNLRFLLVQLPHEITKETEAGKIALENGYKNIVNLSSDRLRKCVKRENRNNGFDIGFKYISLTTSNYKPWKSYHGTSISDLETKLSLFNENPLCDDYNKEGLLTEILLLEGFTLCSSISKLNELKTNAINKITSEYCQHSLLVCLDEKIEKETIAAIELGDDDVFICIDSAISTEDKLRLSDKGLIKTI